jgi:phospholipase/lecithinase/hemolysin
MTPALRLCLMFMLAASCLGSPVSAAHRSKITEVISFGDSLSDCGTFGFKPTTVPSATWNQLLALKFDYDLRPNQTGKLVRVAPNMPEARPGGLCYAQGGARTNAGVAGKPEQLPISGTVQLDHFLAEHKEFSGNQLVTVFLGTNDVLINFSKLNAKIGAGDNAETAKAMAEAKKSVIQAGDDLGTIVQRMINHGAEHVAVLNLYDLGMSDFMGANPVLSGLVNDFNRAALDALPHDPKIVVIDTKAFFADLVAHPGKYGFEHPMDDDACQTPYELGPDCYVDASKWKTTDAYKTHMLIGMVHFTTNTENLLSEYVLRKISRSLTGKPGVSSLKK